MEKKYIPYSLRGQVTKMQTEANFRLQVLKNCLEKHNEGYEDLKMYISKGADYRIKDAENECLQWCLEHKALPYMTERLLEDARNHIAPEVYEYAQELKPLLSIAVPNGMGQDIKVDLLTDITPDFEVNDKWLQRQKKSFERELSDWQMDDYQEFKKLLKKLYDFSARGYTFKDIFDFCDVNENLPDPDLEWIALYYCPSEDMRKKIFEGRTLEKQNQSGNTPSTPIRQNSDDVPIRAK